VEVRQHAKAVQTAFAELRGKKLRLDQNLLRRRLVDFQVLV